MKPWEKFQDQTTKGPWNKFAEPVPEQLKRLNQSPKRKIESFFVQ
jgi:hypothetical protein